jgi:hypothetical protein
MNGDNLKSMRHETRRHFRNKRREYLKVKINELEANSISSNVEGQTNLRKANNLELN